MSETTIVLPSKNKFHQSAGIYFANSTSCHQFQQIGEVASCVRRLVGYTKRLKVTVIKQLICYILQCMSAIVQLSVYHRLTYMKHLPSLGHRMRRNFLLIATDFFLCCRTKVGNLLN